MLPSALFVVEAIGVVKLFALYKSNLNSPSFKATGRFPAITFLAVIEKSAAIGSSLRLILEPSAPRTTLYSVSSRLYPAGAVFSLMMNVLPTYF